MSKLQEHKSLARLDSIDTFAGVEGVHGSTLIAGVRSEASRRYVVLDVEDCATGRVSITMSKERARQLIEELTNFLNSPAELQDQSERHWAARRARLAVEHDALADKAGL